MAKLVNNRKLAAIARESQEEYPRNTRSRITVLPQVNEDYITQVSKEIKIEGRVINKQSQEFSWTENRILGSLSKIDNFFLNPQVRAQSGSVLGTSGISYTENQEPNEHRSQKDPRPEGGTSIYRSPQSTTSDSNEASYRFHI